MNQDGIQLSNVALQTAGGYMNMNGNIRHSGNGDKFNVSANIKQVQVDQLFHAFENFGQDGVTAKNLKGVFSATANMNGEMKADATVKPHTMHGTVTFTLNKGALVNFQPLMNIGKFVFRKRDMSNITFEKIQNTLDVGQQDPHPPDAHCFQRAERGSGGRIRHSQRHGYQSCACRCVIPKKTSW